MSDKNEDASRMEDDENEITDEITEKEKEVVEDDGRTVADMSGIEGHASFIGSLAGLRGDRRKRREDADAVGVKEDKSVDMTRDEKRWFIGGALGAALLIALVFGLGLGLIILLMVIFWK